MNDVIAEKKKEVTRAESIFEGLSDIIKRARSLRAETASVARIVTGDVPPVEPNDEREKPSNFLAGLEDFIQEYGSIIRGVEQNVDHVKEQISIELFARHPVEVNRG